ncbi:MAG: family 10 glycosylhydrolase [Muribaculaceae bacterium]|nr:family 10 glycosylhydrolase [Muribaculaceae bacterium]
MRRLRFILPLILLFSFIPNFISAENIKREFRSVWIATVANIDWPKNKGTSASAVAQQKSDLLDYIEAMEEMNLTTICFQVRSMCDAMYKSSYEPWSSYLTGTRGTDPGWDPLAFMVEECHKRGIEVYAWVNPYRWASSGSESTWNTAFDTEVKNAGWLITNGKFTVLNPGLEETRAHIVKVCREIISNYSVEGLIFDDYFYPSGGTSEGSDAPDYQLWKDSGTSLSIGDWRRENVDKMVSDVYNMVQEVRPELRFGIAPPGTAGASASKYGLSIWPGGYDTQYTSLYSDPLSWMNKHIVDFISPQIYWHNDHSMAPFGKISNWWYGLAAHFKNCHCNISVNIYDLAQAMGYQEDLGNTQEHWDEHVENVLQSRTYAANNGVKAFGSNFYSIQYFTGTYTSHGNYVAEKCFPTKSLVPVVDWKIPTTYSAVNNLTNNNGTLSWTSVKDGLKTIRYTVYAVPRTITKELATTDDGLSGEYLQGVTYNASYSLPTERQSGYWYAVCVYDGYGNEHPAAIINYPEGNYAPKAELISPNDKAEVVDDITFTWKSTDSKVTDFTLQISTSNTFDKIKYSTDVVASNTETTSAIVSATRIGMGTFYWRVVSKGGDYFDTPSDYRTFSIASLGIGETEEGYSILNDDASYSDVNNIHIENLWMRSVRDGFENITFPDDNGIGSWNRSMVAVGDYVYLSGRTANSSSATAYIDKYNGSTGEYLGSISLGANASVAFYPCNNIMKDSNGNVCISNLIVFNQGPLVIHHVDLETGEATQVASIKSTNVPDGRIDHASIIGDVTTGNFTVFGVATNTAKVLRWKFANGSYTEAVATISSFYPTSATSFGLAPRIIPVNEDDIFIDCSNTGLTRYTFSTGVRSGSFLANTAVAPENYGNSGGTIFSLGSRKIVVFANGDENTSPANTFKVVSTTNDLTFSDMQQMWVLPNNGLGAVYSGTYQATADYVDLGNGKVRLYLYIPGNGISAYELTDTNISGVANIEINDIPTKEEYYNLHGVKISKDNLTPGIYIKKQGNNVTKIIIK